MIISVQAYDWRYPMTWMLLIAVFTSRTQLMHPSEAHFTDMGYSFSLNPGMNKQSYIQ